LSASNITPRESEQTSLWSFLTREVEKPTKETRQMTAVATPAGAVSRKTVDWHALDWRKVHRVVRRLQARIVKAVQEGRWGKVQALQHLLTHSLSGKALAVKRVTENPGKRTPGVDGDLWDSPAKKAEAVGHLRRRGYHPLPLRRVRIPKPHSSTLRPLSIPCLRDRAMQALYLLALDPIAETTADRHSYGFRSERCTADALEQCRIVLSRKKAAPWILEGDIQSCFEEISHEWLLAHVPMDRRILSSWLRAGFIEKEVWHPTDAGTPQGGIISPVLMNLTLDGLQQCLQARFRRTKTSNGMVNMVRWADDVRHITWRQIPFTERRGAEDQTSGPTTYLEAKAEGNTSMSLKRRASEGVYDAALQDPRDTVRAILPKPQFPAMEAHILCRQRLVAGSPR
jgi:retron-type reverse transcriptase